jgi:hypothetical protein
MTRTILLALLFCCATACSASGPGKIGDTDGSAVDNRLTYARAFEAVVWATPFLNSLQMRKELDRLGIKDGQLAFVGSPPSPKLIIPTFNNQTVYVFGGFSLKDGPVVMEIPAASDKAKLFGTVENVWDDPLVDIGPAGSDKGKGGVYVFLPPGHEGDAPEGDFVTQLDSFDVHLIFRSVAATDDDKQSWIDAAEYARGIKLGLPGKDLAPAELVDVTKIEFDGRLEGNILAHHDVFGLIDTYIQEEPARPDNLAFRGMLKKLGFEKGKKFSPSKEMQAILDEAQADAFTYMEDYLIAGKGFAPYWDDRRWGGFRITPEILASSFTWNLESEFDYHTRTLDFAYWAVGFPVAFDPDGGGATFYLMTSTDEAGNALDGEKTYKLTVPADVPAKDFWSVIAYSTKTRTFVDSPVFGLSSKDELVVNDDGTIDLYIGSKAPEGFEANLLQSYPEESAFLAFRFYGPTEVLTGGEWKLNDPVLVE